MPVLTFLDSISRGMSGVFVLGCFSLLVVGPFSYFPILPPSPCISLYPWFWLLGRQNQESHHKEKAGLPFMEERSIFWIIVLGKTTQPAFVVWHVIYEWCQESANHTDWSTYWEWGQLPRKGEGWVGKRGSEQIFMTSHTSTVEINDKS